MQPNTISTLFEAMSTWHSGYELFVALLASILVAHIFLYAHNMYTLTYKKTILFFSLSFLAFTVKYITVFLGRYLHYMYNVMGLAQDVSPIIITHLMTILAYTHMIAGICAVLFLLYSSLRTNTIYATVLGVLTILPVFFVQEKIIYYLIINTVILAALTIKVCHSALTKPKASTQLYAFGVIMFFLSILDYFAPWSFHFSFTAEVIISMLGLSCVFLAMRKARIQSQRRV